MFDMHHRAVSRDVQRDVECCEEAVEVVIPSTESLKDFCEPGEDEAPPLSAGFSETGSDVTLVEDDMSSCDMKDHDMSEAADTSFYTWEGVRAW